MRIIVSFLLIGFMIIGCSAQKQAAKEDNNKGQDVYVFDQIGNSNPKNEKKTEKIDSASVVSQVDSTAISDKVKAGKKEEEKPVETPTIETPKLYFVQLGAFTTQERAEEFIKQAEDLLDTKTFTITFSDEKELFLVQLPPFKDKKEAEKVRNRLWKYNLFKDAFIVEQ